tara:strand:+ start:533 stop:676 length:144 start_codon:yes stop_codon:yes gene_type:complete
MSAADMFKQPEALVLNQAAAAQNTTDAGGVAFSQQAPCCWSLLHRNG